VARDKCQRVPSGVRFCLVTGDAAQPRCSLVVTGTPSPRFFQFMPVFECHYLNGTKRVKYLQRVIYNRQQNVHFDSDVGHFVADTELGKPDADYWNSLPGKLEDERASVDTYCQCNYKANEDFILNRRAPPSPPRLW
uniref:MHC class II beta chain N-terminal domain-containing protein n=1 Tax=Cairina moschata TaxID=8855 RepID=A0A8C3CLP7_CAIMO